MKYLKKDTSSNLKKLRYTSSSGRKKLRKGLLKEQYNFCAYSEKYIRDTDEFHIDHFYPKAKYPEQKNNYFNLYAVISWLNTRKPDDINPFLPILSPFSKEIGKRIFYREGIFQPKDIEDKEAKNLIEFLGLNKYELYEERKKHLNRMKTLRKLYGSEEAFVNYLKNYTEELSFITALESELDLELFGLIEKIKK